MFPAAPEDRRAGVILHPTSLPGSYGIGDLGAEAYAFIDWLAEAKMQIWQVLPLVPPGRPIPGIREDYWSPYSGRDASCGNTLIISLQCTLIFWRYQKVDEENAFVKNSVTYTAQATMYITTLGLLVAFILTVVHSKVSEILAKIKKKKAKKRAKKDRKEARLQASGRLFLSLRLVPLEGL